MSAIAQTVSAMDARQNWQWISRANTQIYSITAFYKANQVQAAVGRQAALERSVCSLFIVSAGAETVTQRQTVQLHVCDWAIDYNSQSLCMLSIRNVPRYFLVV